MSGTLVLCPTASTADDGNVPSSPPPGVQADAPTCAPTTLVGGSALPGGVMMRVPGRVGVAVRNEESGEILTETFPTPTPRWRWAKWPLFRGVVAMQTALSTGKKAMAVGERLRWTGELGDEEEDELELGFWGKTAIVAAAILGAAIQILAYRVAPVVIAKEAGLTGWKFIIADAMIRLFLLIGTLLVISRLRPFRKLLAYHGAEHKAIAALEAGAPLTAESAGRFSRFHPRCGTSFLVVSAVVSIGVYGVVLAITGVFTYPALIATRLIGAPIVTALAFELQRQAAKVAYGRWRFLSWPGMAAQWLTTAEPGPRELEVACRALEVALEDPDPEADAAGEEVREGERARAIMEPSPQPSA